MPTDLPNCSKAGVKVQREIKGAVFIHAFTAVHFTMATIFAHRRPHKFGKTQRRFTLLYPSGFPNIALFPPKPRREQCYNRRLSPSTNSVLQYLHKEHRIRVRRLYSSITDNRKFAAVALGKEDLDVDSTDNICRFVSSGHLNPDSATKVLYADRSYHMHGPTNGLSTSAVVYQDEDESGEGF
ncbi:hypothetical protein K458DRAFT_389774 [Lentithecium fluviatile CBS 122367]|uniref:Uncharacterized protein n=1 Tax=Lentithecium fluviatile CBS 122367 TaxID=1168545 RepID=A0A6G1J0X7_9PLEO|nr:hypothetical protein K458DRAFT_389774 [Lentithecium fluviatile CBS 122367]